MNRPTFMPFSAEQKRRRLLLTLALAVATFAVFAPALWNGFVTYDDDAYVYANAHVAGGWTLAGVAWAFTSFDASNWHPLTWLSHMTDCQFFGLAPRGHHLTSVLLHAATGALLFQTLVAMTGAVGRSAFAAAVFSLHPLRVESVAWISERKDVLSGFFFVLTLYSYAHYVRQTSNRQWYSAVLVAYALALLSKPSGVTLPCVLLLLDGWPLGRFSPPQEAASNDEPAVKWTAAVWPLVREKIPLFAMSAASCALTLRAQRSEIELQVSQPLSLRLGNAVLSNVAYLRDFIWPHDLAPLYPFPEHGLPVIQVMLAAALLFIISVGAYVLRRRQPWLLVGWLWNLGMLIPMLGLIKVGDQARADRYTYLPQIGLAIGLAWAGAEAAATRRGWPARAALLTVAALAGLGWLTTQEIAKWKDGRTLWTETLRRTTDNCVAEDNLGGTLMSEGHAAEATLHFRRALAIRPSFAAAHNNLGTVYATSGRPLEAIAEFQDAVVANPHLMSAYGNLGRALSATGRFDEAIPAYRAAVALSPDDATLCTSLGILLVRQGRLDEAIHWFERSAAIQPTERATTRNLEAARRIKARETK